jgi:hypothetical protein
MVVAIKEQDMNFLSIQGLVGKLQAHEERVNKIQEDVGAQTPFSKKMVLDISKEKKEDLEEEAKIVLTDQTIDRMKGID